MMRLQAGPERSPAAPRAAAPRRAARRVRREPLQVAAIGLRAGLGERRAEVVARAFEQVFRTSGCARLALLPGIDDDKVDGARWVRAVRRLAKRYSVLVLFESSGGSREGSAFRAWDPIGGADLLSVRQLFAHSHQANRAPRLVDAVLERSRPGAPGTCTWAGWDVGLLVCGENNVLANAQSRDNAVSVRGRPGARIFEGTHIVCNGAHTLMGNWGKLDRRFEFLSEGGGVALYATNADGRSWARACRLYVDGRRIATGVDASGEVEIVTDVEDEFRAVSIVLRP
jgi:hypothetical protein